MLPSDMVPACLFGLFYDHNQQPDRHSALHPSHPSWPPPPGTLYIPQTLHTPRKPLSSPLAAASTIIQSHAYAQWRSSRAAGHVEIVLYSSTCTVCGWALKKI